MEALEAAEQERANKELGEVDRLKKELEAERLRVSQLDSNFKKERVRTAALMKAAELGFSNPEDAIALTDMSTVEITEDGKVSGFEKSLEALAKSGRLPVKGEMPIIGTPVKGQHRTGNTNPDEPKIEIKL